LWTAILVDFPALDPMDEDFKIKHQDRKKNNIFNANL
jgi:hypothetical protein